MVASTYADEVRQASVDGYGLAKELAESRRLTNLYCFDPIGDSGACGSTESELFIFCVLNGCLTYDHVESKLPRNYSMVKYVVGYWLLHAVRAGSRCSRRYWGQYWCRCLKAARGFGYRRQRLRWYVRLREEESGLVGAVQGCEI